MDLDPTERDAWVADGALVISVGAPLKTWRELDDALMARTLVVYSREAALAESGDVLATGATIDAEMLSDQPGACVLSRWCRRHRQHEFCTLVAPSGKGTTWSQSHVWARRVQPGARHVPSRRCTRRSICGGWL